MKKNYLLFIIALIASYASAQNPSAFIMTWEVQADNLYIRVPVSSTDGTTNFTIDYGDGTAPSNILTHTYSVAGMYSVTVTGDFDRIIFVGSSVSEKIKSIEQWGTTQWSTMESAFYGCTNLVINATDTPDLSQVLSMESMFGNARSFNQPIDNWDVSNVTNMQTMFHNAISFNQALNNWDVSNVTNMQGMFINASAFNQPVNNWDVSNVTNMNQMFSSTSFFNQPINNWDVSNVTTMQGMFSNALAFNQPVNDWDVSNVTNMAYIFQSAISFNQPLNNWQATSAVAFSSKCRILYRATAFNQDMSSWDYTSLLPYSEPANEGPYNLIYFVEQTSLDTDNYDALLLKFAQTNNQWAHFSARNLKYCNTGVRDYLTMQRNWSFYEDVLGENCIPNSVTGTARFDMDGNGCNSEDIAVNDILLTAEGSLGNYSTSIRNERFQLNLFEDNYMLTLQNIPSYFTVTPATAALNFTGLGNSSQLDFCLTANRAVQDLNITLLPTGEARPGFTANYRVVVQNTGTQTVTDAVVNFSYDILKQTFVSASQAPAATNSDFASLNFVIATIQPFETKTIDIVMQTYAPPTVTGGVIEFSTSVTNVNDYTPNDNTFGLKQTVVNSFDPNDKTVLQGSYIATEQLGDYLDYIIRFQNTGTASAITVRIQDILDPNLDWSTLRPVNASHNYEMRISDGNQLTFTFNAINLPAQASNEAGSHGFIAFKIKPLQSLQEGDAVIGSASIYFDYNTPINTNTVTTTILNAVAGSGQYSADKAIAIYPNPVTDVLYMQPAHNILLQEVKVYNMQGRELLYYNQNLNTINMQNLNTGLYLLTVKTTTGQYNYRVIKK